MSAKSIIRQIRIIFFVVFGAMVLFTLGALSIVLGQGAFADLSPIQSSNIQFVVLLCVFAGIPGAHYYHRKKAKSISADLELSEKLMLFKTSFVIKQMIFEGLCLLSLLVYLMSASNTYIIIASLCIITQFINYPSLTRIAEDLSIDAEEFDLEQ